MCFRDWEDTHKKQLQESNYYSRGDRKMKLFEWKNAEMATLIREKFNIPAAKVEEEADKNTGMSGYEGDDEDETYMGHIKKDALEEDSGEEEGEHYERNVEHDDDHIAAIRHHLDALEHDRDYDERHVDETVSSREDPRNRKTGENTNLRPMEEASDEGVSLDEAKIRKAVREALKQFVSKKG